jgi:hypothetical protein
MNYGKEYVKKYNKNLTEIILNALTIFQNHYDSNNSFIKVEKKIAEPLTAELNRIYKKIDPRNDLFEKFINWFETYKKNYTSDKTISVINDEVKTEIFDKAENKGEIENYSEFIDLLYLRESIRYYFNFIDKNKKFLMDEFSAKRIEKAFDLKKKKNELHYLKEQTEKPKLKNTTNLSSNQKMIILHALKNYYKDTKDDDTDTEYFRILALCSDAFDDTDFNLAKTNNNKYKYFLYGANNSDKKEPEKKIQIIDSILIALAPIKGLNRLKKALNYHKTRITNS